MLDKVQNRWTQIDDKLLISLHRRGTKPREIAEILSRSESAVRNRLIIKHGIRLSPGRLLKVANIEVRVRIPKLLHARIREYASANNNTFSGALRDLALKGLTK